MISDRSSYYSLTTPCRNCPFRSDVAPYLTKGRVRELSRGLERGEFTCHKTTVTDPDDDSENIDGPKARHCAGALILMEKASQPSQMMRIAERIGMYDADALDMDAPVFDSWREMIDAQQTRGSRSQTVSAAESGGAR